MGDYLLKLYTSLDTMMLDVNSEYLGVSRHKLMENAGAAVANFIIKRFPNLKRVVIAGLGNNGGDGFVAARHLAREKEVTVILIGSEERIRTEEAKQNFDALKNMIYSVKNT